jgi:TRAP-type C4-dicarboxylate transport system permease small subunit
MKPITILALVLITAGILGLVYGGFTYTSESHDFKLGSLEMSVKDKDTVNIPVWVGTGAIVVGALLFFARQKSL